MNNWTTCKISDVCSSVSDTYKGTDEYVVLVNTSDVLEGKILNHTPTENKNLKGQFKKTFRKNDILYSEIRPANKRFAFVDIENTGNYIASTKLMVLRCDETKVLPKFLFSLLKSSYIINELQLLAETRSGTFPQITFSGELGPMEINLPDFNTQRKIVSVLDSIENKMELSNNMNSNLEQQAQAIFKSWFVDFEPYGGVMPSDWHIGTIDELSKDVICGKTPSTKIPEYYGEDIPFITIPDMHNQIYTVVTERYLSVSGAKSQAKKDLPPNSVCVSCIGTAGLVTLTSTVSQTNQQINAIIPKEGFSAYYIYLLMQTLSETINKLGQSGSTIVNLNKTQFGKIEVLIPSVETMSMFDTIIKPIFDMVLSNQQETLKLISTRDTLFPKLMSGEIDLSSIDI